MGRPQSLRHRYVHESKATDETNYTRSRYEAERTARSGETTGTAPERRCRPALLGDGVGADSPDSPTDAEREPNASETGAHEVEYLVRASSPCTDSQPSRTISG